MVRKQTVKNREERTCLIKSNDVFREELLDRIAKGKDLSLHQYVQGNINDIYGQLGRVSMMQGNEPSKEHKTWIAEFERWSDYNKEYLKQSFSIPDNEYYNDYIRSGQALVFTTDSDIVQLCKEELEEKIEFLDSLAQKSSLLPSCVSVKETVNIKQPIKSKRVFIVHGHDSAIRTQVELLVKNLGYEPVVLFKQPNQGNTIIEKIEKEADDVAFSIVLYTSCDLGNSKEDAEKNKLNPRARQNVVFEHGYMCSALGRRNVCALVESGVETPGDISGIVYIPYDLNGAWQLSIAKEMKSAGMAVDLNRLI